MLRTWQYFSTRHRLSRTATFILELAPVALIQLRVPIYGACLLDMSDFQEAIIREPKGDITYVIADAHVVIWSSS